MPLDGTEGQAFERLGQGISQTIMLNTRARMAQAQLARQQYIDEQNRLLKEAQTARQNQMVMDLLTQQERLKRAGQQIAADYGNPNMQSVGEVIAQSPSAMVNFTQGIKTSPGQQVDRPFAPRIVNEQPRALGVNATLVPNEAGQRGLLGSPSGGYYAPQQGTNAPVQIVPPAPHYGTAQGDVEQLREMKRVMGIPILELSRMEEEDPEQFKYTVEMRRKARQVLGQTPVQGGQGVLPPSQGTNAPVVTPLQIKSIKQVN